MSPRQIHVDLSICCRSGVCAALAPGLVAQDGDGAPVVLGPADRADAGDVPVDELVALCPVGALSTTPGTPSPVESP